MTRSSWQFQPDPPLSKVSEEFWEDSRVVLLSTALVAGNLAPESQMTSCISSGLLPSLAGCSVGDKVLMLESREGLWWAGWQLCCQGVGHGCREQTGSMPLQAATDTSITESALSDTN